MPEQWEENIQTDIAAMKAARNIEGGKFGGGKIHNFQKGWALNIWSAGEKAHYWTLEGTAGRVRSLCHLKTIALNMYGQGDYDQCKMCLRSL